MFFSVFKLRIFAAMKKNQLVALALCLLPLGACNYNGGDFPTPVEGSVILSPTVSNQRINGFAEDKQGHIWMATLRGLDCYIGHEFQQFFCTDDETGLPDNQINDVIALQDGRLCVVTVNGVAFTTDQGHFHRVPIESASKNFSTVLETRSGKLLFSNNSSLYCYFPDQDAILPVFRELNAFGRR